MTSDGYAVTRRSVLGVLGAAGVGRTGAVGGVAAQATGESWPMHRVDARNTGWNPGPEGVATAVETDWVFEAFHGPNGLSVADGTVFVTDDNDVSEPYRGTVYALSAVDGTEQWRREFDRWAQTTPAVADGRVFVTTNGNGDGYVYAFDAENGDRLWRYEAESEIVCAPTVADGRLYLGLIDDAVVALDPATGDVAWQTGVDGRVWGSPAVANGYLYVGTDPSRGPDEPITSPATVYALDTDDGTIQWAHEAGDVRITASPALAEGTVFVVADDGVLRALSVVDGTVEWTHTVGSEGNETPVVHDGTVYANSQGSLVALDAGDGTVQWTYDGETLASQLLGSTGALYAKAGDGLLAVDAAEGTGRRLGTGGRELHPKAVVGDRIYGFDRSQGRVFGYGISERERASGTGTPGSPTATDGDGSSGLPVTTALPVGLLAALLGGLGAYRWLSDDEE
ncbi:PQQ-binding-like beta-propeller repeat protein [Halorientalis pallida]|uniref:outer membrane protein assembly factor BamB family protein n=1 Tax=Halorientalis pallida TaxID=2479928 RepID=UPI003C6EF579